MRAWTPQEEDQLIALFYQGASKGRIAQALCRSKNSIAMRANAKLGLKFLHTRPHKPDAPKPRERIAIDVSALAKFYELGWHCVGTESGKVVMEWPNRAEARYT